MKLFASIFTFYFLFAGWAVAAADADPSAFNQQHESQSAGDKFTREAQPPWVIPVPVPEADSNTAPVVMTLADTQFIWGETKAFFVHRAFRVNEAAALSEVGQQSIEFNPAYQTVTLNIFRITRGHETIDKRDSTKVRFFERELEMEHGLYDGMTTAVILVDDLRVGDTLEIAYTVTGSNPVFGKKVAEYAGWETELPTQKRRVSALYPADRKIRYQYVGGLNADVKVKPKVSQRAGMNQLVFEQSNLKPVHVEEHIPQGFQPFAWIQFSEYADWQEVAEWADGLFRLPVPESKDFAELIIKLRAISDLNKRLAAALRFVQSDIRYASVSMGVNSHLPYAPSIVLERRYGDCKDKSALLVAILQGLGIKAKPVLVSMNFHQGFSSWLPSPTLFDHVIVHVDLDGREYWLDPTAIQEPVNIGMLGYLHGGAEVLVVDASSTALITIPQSAPDEVDEKQLVNLHGFKVPADLEIKTTFSGAAAEVVRANLKRLTPDRIEKYYLDSIRVVYPGARWKKNYEISDDVENNKLVVIRDYSVDGIAELEEHYWHIYRRPDRILDFLEIPSTADRISPYALEYPSHIVFSQTINTQPNIDLENQQEAGAVENDFFRLGKRVRCRGTTTFIEYDLTTRAEQVPAKELSGFAKDIRRARTLLDTSLRISDKFQ